MLEGPERDAGGNTPLFWVPFPPGVMACGLADECEKLHVHKRRRKEEAEAARQQSDRVAAQEQEIWTAKVRAVLASMTWKSGRRRKRSAARAVVGAERVGGGEAAAARAPSTKRGRTPEPDAAFDGACR